MYQSTNYFRTFLLQRMEHLQPQNVMILLRSLDFDFLFCTCPELHISKWIEGRKRKKRFHSRRKKEILLVKARPFALVVEHNFAKSFLFLERVLFIFQKLMWQFRIHRGLQSRFSSGQFDEVSGARLAWKLRATSREKRAPVIIRWSTKWLEITHIFSPADGTDLKIFR